MIGALAVNPTPGFAERWSRWLSRALLTGLGPAECASSKKCCLFQQPRSYKPSSAEQIWALLEVRVILGAWECSWGLALCPRHGVTSGGKAGGSEGTVSLIRCVSRKHNPCPSHWGCPMQISELLVFQTTFKWLSALWRWAAGNIPPAGICITSAHLCKWERLSPHGCGERDSCSFPRASVSGAWHGSSNCDYSLTFAVIQLTAWLVRYYSIL